MIKLKQTIFLFLFILPSISFAQRHSQNARIKRAALEIASKVDSSVISVTTARDIMYHLGQASQLLDDSRNSQDYEKDCYFALVDLKVPDAARIKRICTGAIDNSPVECMKAVAETKMPDWNRREKACRAANHYTAGCYLAAASTKMPDWDERVKACAGIETNMGACLEGMATLKIPSWPRRVQMCQNDIHGETISCLKAAADTGMPDWNRRENACMSATRQVGECLLNAAQRRVPGWDNRVELCTEDFL